MSAPPILLGTASPRRHRILAGLGARFTIVHPGVDERHDDEDAVRTAGANALAKHAWCRARHPDRWVLTADTVVEFQGRCIGKPRDAAHAAALLVAYSERAQHVFTAVALSAPGENPELRVVASSVRFRAITPHTAAAYLALVYTLDRAGGYDIGTHGERIVAGFVGSYTNIMGLPAETVRDWLLARGYALPTETDLPQPPPAWRTETDA